MDLSRSPSSLTLLACLDVAVLTVWSCLQVWLSISWFFPHPFVFLRLLPSLTVHLRSGSFQGPLQLYSFLLLRLSYAWLLKLPHLQISIKCNGHQMLLFTISILWKFQPRFLHKLELVYDSSVSLNTDHSSEVCLIFMSTVVQLLVMSNSLWPHGLHHARLPCLSPSPGACLNSCPSSWWCHPTISLLCRPLLLLPLI